MNKHCGEPAAENVEQEKPNITTEYDVDDFAIIAMYVEVRSYEKVARMFDCDSNFVKQVCLRNKVDLEEILLPDDTIYGIEMCDSDGNVLEEFDTQYDAAKWLAEQHVKHDCCGGCECSYHDEAISRYALQIRETLASEDDSREVCGYRWREAKGKRKAARNVEKYDVTRDEIVECKSITELRKMLHYRSSENICHFYEYCKQHDIPYYRVTKLYKLLKRNAVNNRRNIYPETMQYIIHSTRQYACEKCGNLGKWNNKNLKLQIHHRDGNHHNNTLSNLMIVCPNCHAFIEHRGMRDSGMPNYISILMQKFERKCGCCEIREIDGLPAPIECHHKNGDRQDNTETNLVLLCPNCHSQTENYANKDGFTQKTYDESQLLAALMQSETINEALSRINVSPSRSHYRRAREIASKHNIILIKGNRRGNRINGKTQAKPRTCPKCGNIIKGRNAKQCQKCFKRERLKNIPDKSIIKQLIRTYSFEEIGRMYNVSSNAVKKWCKIYNLPHRKSDINKMSSSEWDVMDTYESAPQERVRYDTVELAKKFAELRSYKATAAYFGCCVKTVKNACQQHQLLLQPLTLKQNTPVIAIDKTDPDSMTIFDTRKQAAAWLAKFQKAKNMQVAEAKIRDVIDYKTRKTAYGYYWREATEEEIKNSSILYIEEPS